MGDVICAQMMMMMEMVDNCKTWVFTFRNPEYLIDLQSGRYILKEIWEADMFAKKHLLLLSLLLLAVTACGSGSQGTSSFEGGLSNPTEFSASAATAMSLDLAWPAVPDATGFLLEAKYGSGEFFEVAQLGADQTLYTHFVVPNYTQITYRLSAVVASGNEEIGVSSVDIPALEPNPLMISQVVPFAPIIGEMPIDFTAIATIDLLNPDPNAMATLAALMSSIDPNNPDSFIPEVTQVSVSQEIGPEGGTISLTDPNGVVYTLIIPVGELDRVTSFTLNPIESIEGLPFNSLLAAVEISPQVPFHDPLTLTVALPDFSTSAEDEIIGFNVSSIDQGLNLDPVYQEGGTFTMQVFWGEVMGIATASEKQIQEQAIRFPSDSGTQIAQLLALLQAQSQDSTQEGITSILFQVLEGLIAQNGDSSQHPTRSRLAAPVPQSGSLQGLNLWRSINAREQLYNRGEAPFRDVPNVRQQSWNEKWGNTINDMVDEISGFLASHTGCRTRDELYADALVRILTNPVGAFQNKLATVYQTKWGTPETLKNCSFQLHVVTSSITQTVDGGALVNVSKVHANPFPMQLVVHSDHVFLIGVGEVIYDELTQKYSACSNILSPTKPTSSPFVINKLEPAYDSDMKVINFKLARVYFDVNAEGPNLGQVESNDDGTCTLTSFLPFWNIWGVSFAVLHNDPRYGPEIWSIQGEESYVATFTTTNYPLREFKETTTMVLTVNQESQ